MDTGIVTIAPNFLDNDYDFWKDNMQLAIMKPFSELYLRDKDKKKRISSKEMLTIFFMCDPDEEKNKFYRIPREDRLTMLKDTLYADFNERDELISDCLEEYPFACLSAVKRALKEEIDSMRKRASYIANFEYEDKSITDIKNFDMIRKATPQILESYEKIEEKFLKEKSVSRIRGGRRKSKAEQGLI